MPLIAVTEVRKRFGSNEVLKGINLDVEPGGVALRPGAAGSGAAVLTCSAGTLARMYRGEVTSGDAFRGGLVALSGEIEALAGLEEVFDEVVFAMGAVARR